jgi:cephalosporin hydroxylase
MLHAAMLPVARPQEYEGWGTMHAACCMHERLHDWPQCVRFANSYEWLGYPLRRLPNDVWVIQELLTAYQPQVGQRNGDGCTTYLVCPSRTPKIPTTQ